MQYNGIGCVLLYPAEAVQHSVHRERNTPARRQHAEQALLRHLILMCVAVLCVCVCAHAITERRWEGVG